MNAPAHQPAPALPVVVLVDASERLIERCRIALAANACVLGSDVEGIGAVASAHRVRVLVVTAAVYGSATHQISDVARRLCARLVKLPSEDMPDRYLVEAITTALGSSGVRRLR